MTKTKAGDPLAFIEMAVAHVGKGCLIWPFNRNQDGYGLVSYTKPNGRRSTTTATRLVLERTAGPAPSRSHQAAHKPKICHNPGCVNPAHLRWATAAENNADQLADGTWPHRRLTLADIRALRSGAETAAAVARRVGVSSTAAQLARNGKNYAHVL